MMKQESFTVAAASAVDAVGYTYDSFMRVAKRDLANCSGTTCTPSTISAASMTFTYDADGLVSTVAGGGATYTITRASNGMLSGTSITTGGLVDSYAYDRYGALTDYLVTYSGTMLYHVTYDRTDAAGRVHTRTESYAGGGTACTWTYAYDPSSTDHTNSYLTQSAQSGGCSGTTNYSYDKHGNDTTSSWSYDNQDRLTSTGGSTFAYTANGDLSATVGTDTYGYDAFGNLRSFSWPGSGLTLAYTIDGYNRRVFRQSTGSSHPHGADTSGWLYSGDRVIAEIDSSGNPISHFAYVTKSNVPDFMLRKEGTVWSPYRIISDGLGTVKGVICAATGGCANSTAYGAFGKPFTGPVEDFHTYSYANDFGAFNGMPQYQPFAFAGGLQDYMGNTTFGRRDYNGWIHRFDTKDPIRFGGGLNLYAYCGNDPINCIDPTGLDGIPWDQILQVLGRGETVVEGGVLGGGLGLLGMVALTWPTIVQAFPPDPVPPYPTPPVPPVPLPISPPPAMVCEGLAASKMKGCSCKCFSPGIGGGPPPSLPPDKRVPGGGQTRYPDKTSCAAACTTAGYSGSECK